MRPTARHILTLALPLALLVAACSSSTGAASTPAATAPAATPVAATASPAASSGGGRYGDSSGSSASTAPSAAPASSPAAGGTTVALADSALGKVLVDGQGRVLYGFKADSAGTPTCAGTCATNWPALIASGTPTAGAGIDASKLTTVDRSDGTKQVKYGDWPLYYFAGDSAAGQTNGQGKGDVWYVLGADGAMVDES